MKSLTHYTKGTPAPREVAPTACRLPISGSISLPSSGCFSPFPHGTCTLSVIEEYLGLEGGPPFSRKSDHHSNTPRFTGKDRTMGTNEQGYHLLWPDLPIFLENQFTARPTPSSVLCCLCLRPKKVADFVKLRRARYGNTAYACCLLVFPSSNPQQIE